ncbi:MAG: hypothetical protein P4L99_06785 [Chthoniobacter sp.]|nr:hypothetical protein [Chthoniobacter sp.]
MTTVELGEKAKAGFFFVVGEVRAAKAELAGYVDRKTGTVMKSVLRKYFVERSGPLGFDMVKITGRAGADVTDPAQVPLGVVIGRVYAFAVEHIERKAGFIQARMSSIEPEEVNEDEAVSAAPSGAADTGAS